MDVSGVSLAIEGTLLCADLSGFTRFTERFSSLGRHGAEEVSAVLDATFTAILGPAIDAGGDVLYFGGDAATIAFTGDGHAERAVRAAAAMQQALGAVERPLDTPGVTLRMTIGVASGALVAALAGRRQHTLVVAGETVDSAVHLQKVARPGQVLVSLPVPAAPPGARWGPGADGTVRARRLHWRSAHPLAPTSGSDAAAVAPLASLIPPALRDLVDAPRAPGELRRTTTGFVLARGLGADRGADPGATLRRIDDLVATIEAASERWEVCWLSTDLGDGALSFVLTAGAPLATEHDEERMVSAVGSILEAAPHGSVQVGLERGVVFAGDVGHPERRTWTVIGDSVNVAARLASAARPGRALVGPELRSTLPHRFDDAALTTLSVKGRRRAVSVAELGRARPQRPPSTPSPASAFVGRRAELAALGEAWMAAGRGRGQVIEVVGEAGIGKTRLLAELRRAATAGGARPHQITHVAPDLYRADAPYATAARLLRVAAGIPEDVSAGDAGVLLRAWVEEIAPHLLGWLPLVADVAGASVPPTLAVDQLAAEFVPERSRDVIVQLLAAARTEPWLLVVEDLHLVDAATRELLAAIARVTRDHPWLVCTSAVGDSNDPDQPGVAEASGATMLPLGPLAPDAAAELVLAAAEPVAVADEVVVRIVDAANGNPLFLEQLAQHSAGVDLEVPDTVERVLAARIDTLAPADRQLLRDLSVLGRTGPVALAAAYLDRPELAEPARWAPLHHFVEVEGGDEGDAHLRFTSDLVRAVAYDGLSVRRRRAMHGEVARKMWASLEPGRLLDDADDLTVVLLATHLLESADTDAAWPVAVAAARRARARVALVDAAALYARALRLAPRRAGPPRAELAAVHEEHGDVCQTLGRFQLALEAYRTAAQLVDDPVDRARLCSRRASVAQKQGALGRASAWSTRGLRLLEGVTSQEASAARAQLSLDQAATCHYQGRNRESIRWAERAAADALATDDVGLLANAHLHLEMAHSMLGDGQAARYGKKAIALFEELGDREGLAHALINCGVTAYDEGRWGDARASYERAAEVAATNGNVTQVATTQMNTAYLLADLGETDRATALCASARRAFRASGNELSLGFIDFLSARLALWSRDPAAASAHLGAARRRFDDTGARQLVLDCDVTGVEVLLVAGDVASAVSQASRLLLEVDAFGPAELLPIAIRRLLSHAARRSGDADTALAAAEQAVALARHHGARFELALSLDAAAHAQLALGRAPDPGWIDERDALLTGLGVRRTIFPLQ